MPASSSSDEIPASEHLRELYRRKCRDNWLKRQERYVNIEAYFTLAVIILFAIALLCALYA